MKKVGVDVDTAALEGNALIDISCRRAKRSISTSR
jgi:hypothetical protein